MLKKNIYIPIEHKNREFLSQILLTSFALKKGFRIYIGNFRGIFKLLSKKKEKSGIFFMKGGLNKKLTNFVKRKCDKYVILDQEVSPGFGVKFYIDWVSNRFYEKTLSSIDLYFCPNKNVLSATKQNYLFKKYKVPTFLSGWTRVDTWRSIFKDLHKNKIRSLKKKYGNFIFFCSDFGVTCKQDFNEYLDAKNLPPDIKKKDIEKFTKQRLFYATKIFEEYQKFILFLKKIDNKKNCPNILIRSHPAESLYGWNRDLKKLKNVRFIKPTELVDPYVFACSGFVHRGSTTTYQAILANKPIVYLKLSNRIFKTFFNVKNNLNDRRNILNCSKIIKKEKELISWAKKSKKNVIIKQHKKINKELNIRSKFAAEYMVEQIDKLYCKKENKLKSFFKEISLLDSFVYKVKNFLSMILAIKKRDVSKTKVRKIHKGIKNKEIKDILLRLKKVLKLNHLKNLSIEQVSDSVVEIEKS